MFPSFSPVIFLIGIGLDIVAFAIHKATGLKLQGIPLTTFAMQMWFMGIFFRYAMIGSVDNAALTAELQGAFNQLVEQFRLSGMSLKTSSGKTVNAFISRKTVFLPKASADSLSKDALDWLIGHELAHQKFFDLQSADPTATARWTLRLACGLLCLMFVALRLQFMGVTIAIEIMLATLVVVLIVRGARSGRDYTHDLELACDYISMVQMDSSQGALEALEVMKHVAKKSDPSNYPVKEERIQQAQDFDEGRPRTPYANAKVETAVTAILAELK